MRRGKNSSQARLETPFLIAISGSAVLLLSSVLSSTIMQSVYPQPSGEQGRLTEESQPSLPSDEQERLIEEARPGVPEEERLIEEAGPGVAEDERLIEESQPSLSSGEQGKLIEEIVKQGSFLMPVEDIRAILEVKEKNTQAAPLAVVGDNVYVLWWENKTGNWEIFFRASSDNGQTFGDEINLSNDSTRSDDGNIAALGNNVYATWWNTNNQTGLREPVFIASDDNGATFGESVRLSGNETTVAVGP